MKIVVIGAGAMGSVYGGLLARAGSDVTLVDLRADHVAAINANGLKLDGVCGELLVRVLAVVEMPAAGVFDAAIIFVDANSTRAAAATALKVLKPSGYAMTLQNGIGNIEALDDVLGRERVIGGVSMDSAAYRGPGHASYTNSGAVYLGELDSKPSTRTTQMIEALQRAGFQAKFTDRVFDYVWQKFTHNCACNAIAAVTGLRNGEAARTPELDAFQDRVMDEIFAVAAKKGVNFPNPALRQYIKDHCFLRYNKPSMLQHMEQGRRTEVDALNGALLREAKAFGIAAPYNESLVALVKGRERAQRQALHETPADYAALERQAETEFARMRGV